MTATNASTREKNQGLGQPVWTSSMGGVVREVPAMKYSSISSSERLRKTSENISLRLKPSSFSVLARVRRRAAMDSKIGWGAAVPASCLPQAEQKRLSGG